MEMGTVWGWKGGGETRTLWIRKQDPGRVGWVEVGVVVMNYWAVYGEVWSHRVCAFIARIHAGWLGDWIREERGVE